MIIVNRHKVFIQDISNKFLKDSIFVVRFKREMNIAGRTRTAVLKTIRSSAKNIGMVAENIDAVKRGALRSGGKQVWRVTATFRDRKRKRRKK